MKTFQKIVNVVAVLVTAIISAQTQTENYIKTTSYQTEVKEEGESQVSESEKIESINYFDGLGRAKQSVAIRAGGQQQDIITVFAYDSLGRQTKKYLPYASSQTQNGAMYIDPLADLTTFYNTEKYENTTNPYSETVLESSPLNRVQEQAAPGNDWAISQGHTIRFDRAVNGSEEVYNIEAVFPDQVNTETPVLQIDGFYSAGELYKNITKDENWTPNDGNHRTSEEFKDKLGRVILKRTYEEIPDDDIGIHNTYYVYDDFGNLTFVIPPKVSVFNGVSSTELSELCYQYRYDDRNRLIEKKIPGKGWENVVYNRIDQPILTQDKNQNEKWPREWSFTKYDAFGRIAYTGLTSGISKVLLTRDGIQSDADDFQNQFVSKTDTTHTIAGTTIYYTNDTYHVDEIGAIHTISYYDNYIFDHNVTNPEMVFDQDVANDVKGLATGSKVRVLGTDDWITTVTYYDDKARPIYVHSTNEYLNTVDIIETELDFTKVLRTRSTHIKGDNDPIVTIDTFTYDHMSRLISQQQSINGQSSELIAKNVYDDLGQLEQKQVGNNEQSPLQHIDYSYNIRGWLTDINDVNAIGDDLFTFKITYNQPSFFSITSDQNMVLNGLYNGNISETLWKTANDNTLRAYGYQYDALNRLSEARDAEDKYSVRNIRYDENGNITSLSRKGFILATDTQPSSFGFIDQLNYQYDTSSNRLTSVNDYASEGSASGFIDIQRGVDDYQYDDNGNMISDINKGITTIDYNYLNLPQSVTINTTQDNGNITYIYDAVGTKLKKIVSQGGSLNSTEYAGNYVYEDGVLQFFSHPEGYIEPVNTAEGTNYQYIYQYKDHLENIRLSYRGKEHTVYADNTFDTDTEGWSTSRGAIITPENGRLKATVRNSFSGVDFRINKSFVTGEKINVRLEIDKLGVDFPLDVLVSYKTLQNQSLGYTILGQPDTGVFEVEHTIPKDVGYIIVKLGIYQARPEDTHFYIDNVKITQGEEGLVILEEKNYYPFGMTHKGYNNGIIGRKHNYGFTGKEEQDELGLGWIDIIARNYDASLGRWMNIDPLSEQFINQTPYNYANNNPMYFMDPDGMASVATGSAGGTWYQGAGRGEDGDSYTTSNSNNGNSHPWQQYFGEKVEQYDGVLAELGYEGTAVEGLVGGWDALKDTGNFLLSLGTVQGWKDLGSGIVMTTVLLSPATGAGEMMRGQVADQISNTIDNVPYMTAYEISYGLSYGTVKVVEGVLLSKGVGLAKNALIGSSSVAGSRGLLQLSSDLYPLKPINGFADVLVHGTPTSLNKSIGEITNQLSKQGLSNMPIRLCACNAGALSNGIAQKLANATGQLVIAPTGYLHIFSTGRYSIQAFSRPLLRWKPSTGRWRGFKPE